MLTNTVQSAKNSTKSLKNVKVLPMEKLKMDIKCKSPSADISYDPNKDEFNHTNYTKLLVNGNIMNLILNLIS